VAGVSDNLQCNCRALDFTSPASCRDVSLLYSQLRVFFSDVCVAKPKSSRNSSLESFVVCRQFFLPKGYICTLRNPLLDHQYYAEGELHGVNRAIVPFVACGDIDGLDADTVYSLEEPLGCTFPAADEEHEPGAASVGYVCLPPVQPPIHAPYEAAIAARRQQTKSE
jgi:tRNA (cytidine32/guanosine34-2'-O)-methyltransferase